MLDTVTTSLQSLHPSLLLTASVLGILVVAFVAAFLIPALKHWYLLRALHRRLQGLKTTDLEELRRVFSNDARLAHLWSEYAETLHSQTDERDGLAVVVAVRSTVPAENYFNHQYVVDSRLRTEFFKHLPGILTGVGIIGTFSGLIGGLSGFQNAFSAGDARINESVHLLLQEVYRAFFVSASAIGAAMVVTLLEKLVVASLYRRTEEIAHDIDARFGSGAGEEYLARIVQASEDSASQSKILKDALVNDLRQLLHEVAAAQIEASREQSQALAKTISGSISASLERPLMDIAGTVKIASGDQSAQASRMLQDVLVSFSDRLNELFGGQISGLSDLNRSTAQSVQDVVSTLQSLVANIETASAKSGDAMSARMADAVERLEQRQHGMNEQTAAFVAQLRQLTMTSQSEIQHKMQATFEDLGAQVGRMTASLQASSERSAEESRARETEVASRTASTVATMTTSVDTAVKEIVAAAAGMQQAVSKLSSTTDSALDKMNYGADRLAHASASFADAGEKVSGTLTNAATVTGQLTSLAGALTTSSSALQRILSDYEAQREAVSRMLVEVRTVVESARKEASLTTDVLQRIQSATEKLASAQLQADHYLVSVGDVLGDAHSKFADATLKTLDRVNADFHAKLSSAVNLLSSSIHEFEASLGEVASVRQ
jgi:hypothetical protein